MIQENLSSQSVQQYKPGDIVYIIPAREVITNTRWPYIGSVSEIDLKVISGRWDTGAMNFFYNLISGHGEHLHDVCQKFLVGPNERAYWAPLGWKKLNEDTELAPAGTIFTKTGEYYSNENLGIYIHDKRFEQIKELFS